MVKNIIAVLDDDEDVLDLVKEIIVKTTTFEVATFSSANDLLNFDRINEILIFVVDCLLPNGDAKTVTTELLKYNLQTPTFIYISGSPYYDFSYFEDLDIVYDFLQKPFNTNLFINKIKIFSKMALEHERLMYEKKKIELDLIDVLNISKFYVMMLDKNMQVCLCSDQLALDLGYKSKKEFVGVDFSTHIPPNLQSGILGLFSKIIKHKNKTQFHEFTNDIITKYGDSLPVKWFNSYVNTTSNYAFCIGMPLSRHDQHHNDTINDLRKYWSDMIQKDETLIDTFRDILDITDNKTIINNLTMEN